MNLKRMVSELIESGMTQQQIADAVNRTQPVICDIYNGKSKRPTYETAIKIERLHRRRISGSFNRTAA